MAKLADTVDKIAEKVTGCYKKIENGVVGGYKSIESGAIEGFEKVSEKCIDVLFARQGESVEDARRRLSGNK